MRDLLDQIELGLQANHYYIALFTALCIPDICAALGSSNGRTTGALYAQWFDQHLGAQYSGFIDGETCYYFRCSLLHQGTSQHPSSPYSRIIFVEPSPARTGVYHCNVVNDALNIDVQRFCRDIIAAAQGWLTQTESTPLFQTNFARFMQRYPNGFSPYMVGMPVIT